LNQKFSCGFGLLCCRLNDFSVGGLRKLGKRIVTLWFVRVRCSLENNWIA